MVNFTIIVMFVKTEVNNNLQQKMNLAKKIYKEKGKIIKICMGFLQNYTIRKT